LSERGLLWAVGLSRRQNVYPADVALISPVVKAGKPRKHYIPDQPPVSAEALLAGGKWQKVSWRRGCGANSTNGREIGGSGVLWIRRQAPQSRSLALFCQSF